MKTEPSFDLADPDYSVRLLRREDIGAIQDLYVRCLDYMLLVDGRPADPGAVEEEFQSVPSGKTLADKFVFGIFDRQHVLSGLLDTVRGYPDRATWWLDTLLLVPEARSRGLGQKVFQAFAGYVEASDGQAIMLGVVEENTRALKFWQKMGFEFLRQTAPEPFGNKIQRVTIMRLALPLASIGEE